jgi:hypothetical protein
VREREREEKRDVDEAKGVQTPRDAERSRAEAWHLVEEEGYSLAAAAKEVCLPLAFFRSLPLHFGFSTVTCAPFFPFLLKVPLLFVSACPLQAETKCSGPNEMM